MKILEIATETKHNGLLRKVVSMPVDESMAEQLQKLMEDYASRKGSDMEHTDPKEGIVAEGTARIRVTLAITDARVSM